MKQKHMTKEMRERIEKGIRDGLSLKEIAEIIDKDPTTISKEVLKHRKEYLQSVSIIGWSTCNKCKNRFNTDDCKPYERISNCSNKIY